MRGQGPEPEEGRDLPCIQLRGLKVLSLNAFLTQGIRITSDPLSQQKRVRIVNIIHAVLIRLAKLHVVQITYLGHQRGECT